MIKVIHTAPILMSDTNYKEILHTAVGIFGARFSPNFVNSHLKTIEIRNLTEDSMELVVPNSIAAKKLDEIGPTVDEIFSKILNKNIKIKVIIDTQYFKIIKSNRIDTATLGPLFEQEKNNAMVTQEQIKNAGLNPNFTFANFLVGSHNQLAYAIAMSIADNPGERYNPFFLYSGVGLGKTHLMQAIGLKIIESRPSAKVVYVPSEKFMNELIESIQKGKDPKQKGTSDFRKKYREADVLLLDDIQFIVGRESTQVEFFHTFNNLIMDGRQIVVTSDRPPKDFVNLEERITSRLGSGIIADMQEPDTDTREAILRNIRQKHTDNIDDETIKYIAETVNTNIRELLGAYNTIISSANATKTPLDINFAKSIIEKDVKTKQNRNITPEEIINTVCKYYNIRKLDIKSKTRTKEIALPRQIIMFLMKDMTSLGLENIGNLLGGRDHTTIMHGVRKIEDEFQKQKSLVKDDLVRIKKEF